MSSTHFASNFKRHVAGMPNRKLAFLSKCRSIPPQARVPDTQKSVVQSRTSQNVDSACDWLRVWRSGWHFELTARRNAGLTPRCAKVLLVLIVYLKRNASKASPYCLNFTGVRLETGFRRCHATAASLGSAEVGDEFA